MSASPKPEPGTSVATVEQPARPYMLRSPVAELLNKEGARAAIAPMLRPGESYDRIVVEVYHAAAKNPEILKCTPQSIVSSVARAVATGLYIGEGVHLVPFGDKLEMVIDYKGAAELVLMSRAARYLDAQCHYAAEHFEYEQGSHPFIRHQPVVDPRARGDLVGAYAVAKVNRDDVRIVYMAVEEIDAIRLTKSKAWKKGPLSAIPWYAKKTVIKQIVKLLPKNRELAKVMALLEREDSEGAEDDDARPLVTRFDPADEIRAPQLPPRVNPADPYDVNASGEVQPREAERATPMAQTEAHRATAAAASQLADPFADGRPAAPIDENEPGDDAGEAPADIRPEPASIGDTRREASATPASTASQRKASTSTHIMKFGGEYVGKPITEVPTPDLLRLLAWAEKRRDQSEFIDAAKIEIDDRRWADEANG